MSFWKQALVSVVLLAAAFLGWAKFFPGADDVLARWGVDWVPFATADARPSEQARNAVGNGNGQPRIQQPVIAATVTQETINSRLSCRDINSPLRRYGAFSVDMARC